MPNPEVKIVNIIIEGPTNTNKHVIAKTIFNDLKRRNLIISIPNIGEIDNPSNDLDNCDKSELPDQNTIFKIIEKTKN